MKKYQVEVDNTTLQIVKSFKEACSAVNIHAWFVCGATARVLLCEKASGMNPGRATGDIDFAVRADRHEVYSDLRRYLCENYDFKPDRHEMQRLVYKDGFFIDIVPFGSISDSEGDITWGEDDDFKMSVIGFEEAMNSAIKVTVAPDIEIPVVSYVEQLGLKLLAWSDRHVRRSTEDSRDIAYLIQNAHRWYSENTLYDRFPSILESLDYDIEMMAVYILGSDIGINFNLNTVKRIRSIIERDFLPVLRVLHALP